MARRKQDTGQLTLPSADIPTRALTEEVESAFLEYSMSVIVSRALPDVRDGLKPVAAPDLVGDARRQPPPGPALREVCARRRRRHGELPPARRRRDLRRTRAHGAVVLAHRPADRQARQLRFAGRPAGCRALHRVPALAARDGDARRHRRRHRRLRAELRRVRQRAARSSRALPEPARERRAGDRSGDGHEHPAPQPRRGVHRGAEAHRQRRTRRSGSSLAS